MKTPLYLDVYAQIVLSGENSNPAQISTLQDLYGRLWTLRIEHKDRNAPSALERRQAVFHLVELMQQQRKIKLHISSLDAYPHPRRYLRRTGFIREEGHSLSFLHQTLFSYCFARKFVSERKSLSSEIFNSPQGFFERQLMIEVVQHLRSTDLESYHSEVSLLLFPPESIRVRYHLRLLLLKWLAWQTEPTDQEFSLLARLERINLEDFYLWLKDAGNNVGWFQRFRGEISRWLASHDSQLITMAIRYLGNFRDTHTKFVVEHIKPYLDSNPDWNKRIAWIVLYIENWSDSKDALNLLMHLIRNGYIVIQDSNLSLVAMANTNVIAGCQLIKLHCKLAHDAYRELKSRQTDQLSKPLPEEALKQAIDAWETRQFILKVSRSDPQAVLDHLLPCFVDMVVELTKEKEITKRHYRSHWFFYDLNKTASVNDRDGISLADGILQALSHLALTNPMAFRDQVSRLASIDIRIIQQLLLRAYKANPSEYVTEIYTFLTEDIRRLQIQPDARYLLGAAYQYSDQPFRAKWEDLIFSLPQAEIDNEEKSLENWRRRLRWRQSDQLDFLLSLDDSLLSNTARRRKQEFLRLPEFEDYVPFDGNREVVVRAVQAPIPLDRQKKLSPKDRLRVMRRYGDETARGNPQKRPLEGGVVEMSRSTVEQVKIDPESFYHLSQEFDEDISMKYVTAIIQGFAHEDTEASPKWMFDLFRRFHSRMTGGSRIDASKALLVKAPSEVPDDIVDILVMWVKDDPDPDCEEEHEQIWEIVKRASPQSDGLINRAINSVRGSVLENVCKILFQKEPIQLDRMYKIIEHSSHDDCASVRAMAVDQLLHWHNESKDRDRSIEVLETAIKGRVILLTTYPVHYYLNWLSFTDPKRALPYLEIMPDIPHEHTQYMAGQIICLAGLYEKAGFVELAIDLHTHENPALRRAAANIYAQEIGKPDKTAICCERLLMLMQDEDEQVRIQTTGCFARLQGEHLLLLQNFFRQFIETPAREHSGHAFIDYLTRSDSGTLDEQLLSLSLVKDLLEAVGKDLGNYDSGFLRLQREMTLYLRNLYDKTTDNQLRENVMDMFDELLRLGSNEAHKMLEREDMEWLPH